MCVGSLSLLKPFYLLQNYYLSCFTTIKVINLSQRQEQRQKKKQINKTISTNHWLGTEMNNSNTDLYFLSAKRAAIDGFFDGLINGGWTGN